MSGFLIDGVPFVSEGKDIQGYLDSGYPGNVNEYTTTTNTGVTTPVPGLEEHNYNALKPNLPTRYKLRDVSLNEYAFAFSGTYNDGSNSFYVPIPARFDKVFYVISGGGGGKGGKGHSVNVKANSANNNPKANYGGGEGGIGASGEIITGSLSVDDYTRNIQIIRIGISGEDGISRNGLQLIKQKADDYNSKTYHNVPDDGNLDPGGSGEDGNATTIMVGTQYITAGGGSGGGGGGASSGKSRAYWGSNYRNEVFWNYNYHTDIGGNHGTPGTPGTPYDNPNYTQSNQGTVREWRPEVGNNGFVKIYFS